MSQRIRDVFAWIRLFMSTQGPPPTTRLVLFAHSLFMDRDGSHCRVGVRRLADITGLDKTTVAQHRAAAIKRGWLIGSKPPRGQGSGEIYAAAPDGVRGTDNGQAIVWIKWLGTHKDYDQIEVTEVDYGD
jgi:hypothetical protein